MKLHTFCLSNFHNIFKGSREPYIVFENYTCNVFNVYIHVSSQIYLWVMFWSTNTNFLNPQCSTLKLAKFFPVFNTWEQSIWKRVKYMNKNESAFMILNIIHTCMYARCLCIHSAIHGIWLLLNLIELRK